MVPTIFLLLFMIYYYFFCYGPEKIPQQIWWRSFASLEPRRRLGQVNFRKDFWDG